ncbi:hypothetical protein B0A48_16752 [Cryoendolithus antarcticus]|uniref:Uncharacterized protein n=1 Tax=Cryoendolithus antarcticus TaxID=1507870 RepID=A0A1V8SEG4_9PEZI|nr:hypothetical protein B0A48_16752 [Cryoendolithus antarcticus]
MDPCPIPAVSRALEPYIKSRSEVLSIRQNLYGHLESHLHLETATPLCCANVADPPLSRPLGEPPTSLTGVRKAYYRALVAHQAAQKRYDGLKSELQGLSAGITSHVSPQPGSDSTDVLSLLRAREKRRRLLVLSHALDGIEDAGSALGSVAIDDVVRKRAGEVPVPPTKWQHDAANGHGGVDARQRLGELQRAVLSAKGTVERCERSELDRGNGSESDDELLALQQTRNELIAWIERQLALIGEGQGESERVPPTPASANGTHRDEEVAASVEEIEDLYEGYLEARSSLLQTLQSRPRSFNHGNDLNGTTQRSAPDSSVETTRATAVTLLPYVISLLEMKDSEVALSQQQAFLRKELTIAEAATDRLLRRHADESHLVHPGASRGKDWALAGAEAGQQTRKFVEGRLNAGEAAAKLADAKLDALGSVRDDLEKLEKSME